MRSSSSSSTASPVVAGQSQNSIWKFFSTESPNSIEGDRSGSSTKVEIEIVDTAGAAASRTADTGGPNGVISEQQLVELHRRAMKAVTQRLLAVSLWEQLLEKTDELQLLSTFTNSSSDVEGSTLQNVDNSCCRSLTVLWYSHGRRLVCHTAFWLLAVSSLCIAGAETTLMVTRVDLSPLSWVHRGVVIFIAPKSNVVDDIQSPFNSINNIESKDTSVHLPKEKFRLLVEDDTTRTTPVAAHMGTRVGTHIRQLLLQHINNTSIDGHSQLSSSLSNGSYHRCQQSNVSIVGEDSHSRELYWRLSDVPAHKVQLNTPHTAPQTTTPHIAPQTVSQTELLNIAVPTNPDLSAQRDHQQQAVPLSTKSDAAVNNKAAVNGTATVNNKAAVN
eukprot:Lankesteria_metandrocarpae@DN9549_c0_g1_i1.p1